MVKSIKIFNVMKNFLFIMFIGFLFFACSEKDKACIGICSEEYRNIVVYVKNIQSEPVILDSFKVLYFTNGSNIMLHLNDYTNDYQRERGIYPIFSDKYAREYKEQQTQIKFSGFIDGHEVVSETYKVAADCCHVIHLSGDLELVIQE